MQGNVNTKYLQEDWLKQNKPELYWTMLQTAENVAKRYKIPKDKQDEYGVRSQQRAAAARAAGKFNDEIVPMTTIAGTTDPGTGAMSDLQSTRPAELALPGVRVAMAALHLLLQEKGQVARQRESPIDG